MQNALTLTAVDSRQYPHSWLSFSLSREVAIWFAGQKGTLVETDTVLLAECGIEFRENSTRVPWEQEVSIDLSSHEKLPLGTITSFTEIDQSEFRRAVARLWAEHPEIRLFEDVLLSPD
ncbi:hypothetical protein ABE493_07945 [Stenotrophomonas terrae]|uniref:hypothetical protein n=1 Tax=Stenotrophomonas terrae TaxID=405446 RepID=UPI003208FAC2